MRVNGEKTRLRPGPAIGLIGIIAVGFAAWQLIVKDSGKQSREEITASSHWGSTEATRVVLVPVVRELIYDSVEALGTAQANESVTVTAKVSDTVSKLHFEDGDIVEKDAVLMELTNTEQSAFLEEARVNYEDARSNLQRIEDLGQRGNASESAVDEARARASGAKARRDAIVARLEDRVITAPFSGVLGFRQVSRGTLVTPGTPITTLDDISIIKLDFSIPAIMLSDVTQGKSIIAASATWPDREFPGTVSSIGSRIDPVTRSAMVRAVIQNDEGLIHPGMLLTVDLLTREREALTIPEGALQQISGRIFVYMMDDDGNAVRRYVMLDRRLRGKVVIAEGLEEGEMVIAQGTLGLYDGAAVQASTADGRPLLATGSRPDAGEEESDGSQPQRNNPI